jgi:hypothetical protein
MATVLNETTKGALFDEYKEFGQWARHYSAVRLTLATFFVTLSFGTIQFRWDKPDLAIGIIALVIFGLGFCLFLFFSNLTFDRMRKQMEAYNKYLESTVKSVDDKVLKEREEPKTIENLSVRKAPDGLTAAIAVLLVFVAYDIFWLLPVLTDSNVPRLTRRVTIPLELKVGEANTVRVDVPIAITIPTGGQALLPPDGKQ